MSSETSNIEKTCLTCKQTKKVNMFVIGRNLCKSCRNEKTRNDYSNINLSKITEQKCNVCDIVKDIKEYHKGKKICIICTNIKRKERYANNVNYRNRVINETIKYRKSKNWIDSPLEQFKRKVRSNILRYLTTKTKRTMEYLGCSREEYMKWLMINKNNYTLDNHGKEWHIDHVIPLSKFDLNVPEQQLIAFNWRNTMPLSCKENLNKNNKIIKLQVEEHYKKLLKYHEENNLDLPQVYIDLFAKHLVAGSP